MLRKKKFRNNDIEKASEKCDNCGRYFCEYDLIKTRRTEKSKPIMKLCFGCHDSFGFNIIYGFILSNDLDKKYITTLKKMKEDYDKMESNKIHPLNGLIMGGK